jgi:uncharacterized membrane-anchored protein
MPWVVNGITSPIWRRIVAATNAFFFQEGTAMRYQGARYGEFRVAPDGELRLTGLRGSELQGL